MNNYEDDYCYDEAPEGHLFFERSKNEKIIEMNKIGYSFITNFTPEREYIYRNAAKLHNMEIKICEAFDGLGRIMDYGGYQALYVDSTIVDMSDFWRSVDELSNRV